MKLLHSSILLLAAGVGFTCGLEYANDNLKVVKDVTVSEGSSTSFTCEITDAAQSIQDCNVMTPRGDTWNIVNGLVIDESGGIVLGYAGVDHGSPDRVCGIDIASIGTADLGTA